MQSTNPEHHTPPAVRLVGVTKQYPLGNVTVAALRGVSLKLAAGSFSAISGPSGSGKSSLLNLIGCIDSATSGVVEVAGRDVSTLTDFQKTEFRAKHIGFVFQNFNLLPVLTVLENVEYPLQLSEPHADRRRARAREALASVGLEDLQARRPTDLSGGQRQRVAIARALVKQPALVLADEPTANLDRKTGAELIALLRWMQRDSGTTFVFSSHDPQLIDEADTQIALDDGLMADRTERAGNDSSLRRPQ